MAKGNGAKKERPVFLLPEGRLINHALFERDVYEDPRGKKGDPMYKIEMAYDPKQIEGEGTIEDKLLEAALDEWGDTKKIEDEFFNGTIRIPFIDGNKLAAKREEKGKQGDAYKGKLIIRCNTKFNKDGIEGPGGVSVYDENVNEVGPVQGNTGLIYLGCYGIPAVTISAGRDVGSDDKHVKFWLVSFQKTRDGEKLAGSRDTSKLFKPVGRTEGGGDGERRRRRG